MRVNVVGREIAPAVTLDRRRRRLASVVRQHADLRRPFVVSVHRRGDVMRPEDHTVRRRADWARTLVEPGHVVLITYLPRGGGGSSNQSSGKQIGMAVGMIALVAAAAWAAPLVAGGLVSGASGGLFTTASSALVGATQAGLVVGGAALLSLAMRAGANDDDNESSRQLYGVSGGGNLPRPGDRIPVGYGTFWTQPDLTQADYTVYDGDDQILYKRVTLGLGKYRVHKMMLGTATLWTEDGGIQEPFVSIQGSGSSALTRTSGTGGSSIGPTEIEIIQPGGSSPLVPGSVYTNGNVAGIELPYPGDNPGWSGPFVCCESGSRTSTIQIDYEAPMGVVNNGWDDGKAHAANWSVEFQYAACDDDDQQIGDWVQLHSNGFSTKSLTALRFTRKIPVPEGRYLVRARNTQSESDVVVNTATWSGLRSHFDDAVVRPHVTEIALRVRSDKSLGVTSFADLWVQATRILLVWDGAEWVEQPTRKAVYAFADVLRNADYGAAMSDSQIDLDRIAHYASTLTEFDTYDGVIRGPVSVYEAASVALSTIRAEPANFGAVWSFTRDEQKDVRKHVFTRRQIKQGTTAATFPVARDDGSADVIAEYYVDGDPRRRREVRVTYGAETLWPQRQQLQGVTTHEHATHLARWIAACAYYRRERRRFSADRQGRLVTRGDPVRVDAWFMADARAAGILSATGRTLTLDTAMEIADGRYARLRDRKGREWGPCAVTWPNAEQPNVVVLDAADVAAAEDYHGMPLDSVLADPAEDMTSVQIGPLIELEDPYLVVSVTPQGRDDIAIEAVYDHPSVWEALGEPILPGPSIPSFGTEVPAVPTVPWVRAQCVERSTSLDVDWACGTARGAASYIVMLSYDGQTWEQVSEGLSTSGSYPIRHEEGVTVTVAAYAVNGYGVAGPTVFTSLTTFTPSIQASVSLLQQLISQVNALFRDVTGQLDEWSEIVAAAALSRSQAEWLDKQTIRREITATGGKALAAVTELATTVATEQQAFADYRVTVSATFDGLTASVESNSSAIAMVDGKLLATASLQLNSDGYVSGWRAYNDGSTSAFIVQADTFAVAWSGLAGGDVVPVFTIANVNGVAKLAFRGDMIADGGILAGQLSVATLSSITANIGDVTAGVVRSANNLFRIELDNARLIISDG
ncbi:hypothetical protein A33M_1697 [Rhodovulum sp. PH10]|nr:hypothetical protein A33M_1697 [Rhodovulum sp. PH10]